MSREDASREATVLILTRAHVHIRPLRGNVLGGDTFCLPAL